MNPLKLFLFLLTFCVGISVTRAQNNRWILGEWKGTGVIPGSAYSTVFVRTLIIKSETKNRFAGILIQEVTDNKGTRIEKEITGSILNDEITITGGRTLYKKQPPHGFWADCNACKMSSTRISVSSDSLILTNETRLCGNYCDGYTNYYKPLADYDTATQRKLVQLFGSPLLVKIFKPVIRNNETPVLSETKSVATSGTIQNQLSRKTKTIATYNVSSAEIKIELFDNGEIDGDTVTVYHNKQKIINRQLLGIQPLVYTIKTNTRDRVHEFVLVADNLGRIPPNTALMRITAGSKAYELFASTTLEANASVIIIYSGEQ